jgi:hypothetical protein
VRGPDTRDHGYNSTLVLVEIKVNLVQAGFYNSRDNQPIILSDLKKYYLIQFSLEVETLHLLTLNLLPQVRWSQRLVAI